MTRLAICARSLPDVHAAARELRSAGAFVHAESCDLSNPVAAQRFIESAREALGGIELLVTNAATIAVGPVSVLSKVDFDEAHGAIFDTALNPVLAALPHLRGRGTGTIVFVTSIGGRVGVPHLAPYCAAKFATMGFAEALRSELSRDGVHVMTVVPGLMRTGSHIHVEAVGDVEGEYGWFGAAATTPILSIDPVRAARRIVRGIERGSTEISFTPEARLAPILRAIAPGLWAKALEITARLLLPQAPQNVGRVRRMEGIDIERTSPAPAVALVKRRGAGAANRNAQHRRSAARV